MSERTGKAIVCAVLFVGLAVRLGHHEPGTRDFIVLLLSAVAFFWAAILLAFTGSRGPGPTEKPPASTPQPQPGPGQVDVADHILADIAARGAMGQEKYGTKLQTNGRCDAFWDGYLEALDLAVYLRRAILEHCGEGDER